MRVHTCAHVHLNVCMCVRVPVDSYGYVCVSARVFVCA